MRTRLVYKIPYRRARAWPSARASKGILHTSTRPMQPVGQTRATIGYLVNNFLISIKQLFFESKNYFIINSTNQYIFI